MINITLDEDGEEIYHNEDQNLVFIASDDDYVIKGYGDYRDILALAVNTLTFLYDTIKNSTEEDFPIFEYLNDIIQNIENSTSESSMEYHQTILKCSNIKDLKKASNLAMEIDKIFRDKLPDCKFVGLDYDKLIKQLGDDKDDETN